MHVCRIKIWRKKGIKMGNVKIVSDGIIGRNTKVIDTETDEVIPDLYKAVITCDVNDVNRVVLYGMGEVDAIAKLTDQQREDIRELFGEIINEIELVDEKHIGEEYIDDEKIAVTYHEKVVDPKVKEYKQRLNEILADKNELNRGN